MYRDAACHSRLAAVSEVIFCPAFHPLSTPFWISAALLCPFGLGFYCIPSDSFDPAQRVEHAVSRSVLLV